MNKTVDETIRNWKLELETQSDSFEKNCEKLKQFEFKFLKNFESVKLIKNKIKNIDRHFK